MKKLPNVHALMRSAQIWNPHSPTIIYNTQQVQVCIKQKQIIALAPKIWLSQKEIPIFKDPT